MQYHAASHAADRLVERTATTGVFDPRKRQIVDASLLDRGDLYGLCKAQLHRSHLLPAKWQRLLAPRMYGSLGQLPEGQVITRFDDYLWVLKLVDTMKYKAVTMLVATPEQMEMLGIEPHELYVTIAGTMMAPMRSQMQERGLPAVMMALEDMVRRAVHFGTPISWDQAREAVGTRMTHGSSRWSWYAGPVSESWDEEHLQDRPLTLVVGMRFMNGLAQTDAAYVLDYPYTANDWFDTDLLEMTVDDAVPVTGSPVIVEEPPMLAQTLASSPVSSRERLYLPIRRDGQTAIRAGSLRRFFVELQHEEYVLRQLRRMQATPLSSWGVYNLFGHNDESEAAGCLFPFGEYLPLPGYGIALCYTRRISGKGWRVISATILQSPIDESYLIR